MLYNIIMEGGIYMTSFYYLGNSYFKTDDGKEFLKIQVLELSNFHIYTIYKIYNKELGNKFSALKLFDNINSKVKFVIKRNGDITLDID